MPAPLTIPAIALLASIAAAPQAQPSTTIPHKTWVERHPALTGAFVGAGGGVIYAMTAENEVFCSGGDEDCVFYAKKRPLIGAAFGTGVGSLIGWIIGR